MKLSMMVLGENKHTLENNQNDTWEEIQGKFEEEYLEVVEAITEGNRVHMGEEIFDVLQVCIRALRKLELEGYNLEQLSRRHNKKLVKRGWENKKTINIFVKK